jgi:hypothetical protein
MAKELKSIVLETKNPAGISADGLSESESILLRLFRLVPEKDRGMVLKMIEAALYSQGLL